MHNTKSKTNITFVPKSWGFEKIIVNNDLYCGKILFFVKGSTASMHYHLDKTETFYVNSGLIQLYVAKVPYDVIVNDKESEDLLDDYFVCHVLDEGDSYHLPKGTVHKVFALKESQVFEFSTHSEDSDSYRIVR